jgi:hypothetical protein
MNHIHKADDPRDLKNIMARRVRTEMSSFVTKMKEGTGMPYSVCEQYVLTMLTTDMDRQCASCLGLHRNYSSVSWFHDPDARATVLWAACKECIAAATTEDPDVIDKLSQTAQTTLDSWISGSLDPLGLVVIFSPPKTTDDADEEADDE